MKLNFKDIRPINYVRAEQGTFDLGELSPKELNSYIKKYRECLISNWQKRKQMLIKEDKEK